MRLMGVASLLAVVLSVSSAATEWTCDFKDDRGVSYDLSALKGKEFSGKDAGDPENYFKVRICENFAEECEDHGVRARGYFYQMRERDDQCMGWQGEWGKDDPKLLYKPIGAHGDRLGFSIETYSGAGNAGCADQRRKSEISFRCNPDVADDKIDFTVKEDEAQVGNTCFYRTTIETRHACPKGGSDSGGLSGGWIFFIVVTCSFAVYCLGGCVFMYFAKGQRGKAIVPNGAFWAGLPSLVKDGASFTSGAVSSKFKGTSGGAVGGTKAYSTLGENQTA